MSVYTRKTKLKDILAVANDMRPADLAEVQAASGREPKEVLLQCFFEGQPCMTICGEDDEPIGMWGVIPMGEMLGGVWMLAANSLVKSKARQWSFLRQARSYVDQMQEEYPVLANCVDARNKVHIRWLRWMGFTFIAEHPNYGAEGRLFLEFVRTSHV